MIPVKPWLHQNGLDGRHAMPWFNRLRAVDGAEMSLPKPYYESDGIVIYHADCRDILPHLPKVDLVLTDPPYGVGYSTWDRTVPRPQDWLYWCISSAKTVYVTPSNGQAILYPHPSWTMAWFRPGSIQRCREGTGFSHWEPILVYGEHVASVDAKQIRAIPQPDGVGHPCPKPFELFSWLINTTEAQMILDPFMGSGTTVHAAKKLGRRAIGIEIEEKYCAIAVRRLAQEVLPL